MVTVTSLEEQFDMTHATVKVFNMLGQQIYSGDVSSMNIEKWKPGAYLLRYSTQDGKTVTKKTIIH